MCLAVTRAVPLPGGAEDRGDGPDGDARGPCPTVC